MKIYFVGSISGKEQYLENYQAIIKTLHDAGHEVLENTIEPSKKYVYSLSDEGKIEQYKNVLKWISSADLIVAEGSFSSMGVGYEISLALEKGKPVLVLFEEGHAPHFLEGIQSEKLLIEKYDRANLGDILKVGIDFLSDQQDTRFNFFISPKHQHYLDWVAKHRKIPRAVFLRKLIEDDMNKHSEYAE